MAKSPSTIYVCQNCGNQQRKWQGQCPDCGEWNTFVEEKFRATAQTIGKSSSVKNVRFSSDAFREVKPISYSEIESQDDARTSSGIEEFDRVLGGGIVDGSIVLIGGAPGIGKCLSGSARLFDAQTGDFLEIGEWKNQNRNVLSLDVESQKFSIENSTAFHEQGKKSVYEIETMLGRKIRCTANHPFLTVEGWKMLSELKTGDRIAAPRSLPYFGNESMDENEFSLIAYLLSDGSPQKSITITATLPEAERDIYAIADYFNLQVRIYEKKETKARDFRLTVPKREKVLARKSFAKI